jgi:hypothetical protein
MTGWFKDNWKFGATAVASVLLMAATLGVYHHFATPTDPPPEPAPVAVLTVPAEVKFTPGVPVTVTAEIGPGVTGKVVWYVPSMCKVWSHTTGTTLIVSSTRESPFAAAAFTTTKDGIAGPFEVRFVPDKPVPPGPVPPGPTPPAPTDPFTLSLQAAFAKESAADKAKLPQLADVFSASAKAVLVATDPTCFAFFQRMHATADTLVGKGVLPNVRAAITADLDATLPTTTATLLDDGAKAQCKAEFEKIAAALGGLK